MADDWKEEIIKNKLGGKRDWTDQERQELSHQLDKEIESHLLKSKNENKSRPKDAWTEDNWEEVKI